MCVLHISHRLFCNTLLNDTPKMVYRSTEPVAAAAEAAASEEEASLETEPLPAKTQQDSTESKPDVG